MKDFSGEKRCWEVKKHQYWNLLCVCIDDGQEWWKMDKNETNNGNVMMIMMMRMTIDSFFLFFFFMIA